MVNFAQERVVSQAFLTDMIFTQNLLIASTEDEATYKQGHPELHAWYHASMDATRKLSNFFFF
jgi:hypothetical protein